jgi:RNA polymerase sigma-70 factor (ECF subfamily)
MQKRSDFNQIYDEFQPRIHRYIARLAGDIEVDDITQEVFEKVNRSLDSFKGVSSISTWIYRIATNTVLDRLRSPSFKRVTEDLMDEAGDENIWTGRKKAPVDQQLVRKEMSECVKEHIDKLPPDYKTIVILSELEEFKNREIAEILRISLDTVKIRLHRARAELKKILDNACAFYHNEQNILACDRKQPFIKITPHPKK